MLPKIEKALFYLLIFLIPTQLAYHFWPNWAFVFGVRVDYLAPTIYLTDIILIILLAISRTKIKTASLLGVLLFAFINILVSSSPWASLWKWGKVIEIIFFAKYVHDNSHLIKDRFFSQVVSLSLVLISTLGIMQFFKGGTLGGIFYLIGERSFDLNTPGIALQQINGTDYLRAYSSFSHPNSLAGLLSLGIIYLVSLKKKDNLVKLSLALSIICFLLTFSLSALIAVVLTFLVWLLFKKESSISKVFLFILSSLVIASFLLPFIPNRGIYPLEVKERIEQATLAGNLISKNLLLGAGLNTFSSINSKLQPVHNIFLLVLTETGLVGLGLFLVFVYKAIKTNLSLLLLVILIISFFDHYFLTLQQNLLTLSLVFGTIFASQKRLKLERDK